MTVKTNPLRTFAIATAAWLLGFAPLSLNATTATWTNGAAGNAWETAGNWDINMVPVNNSFDVVIPIAAPCNLSNGYQIGSLNLSVNTANLNLVPGALLAFTSDVTNNGAILVNTTGLNNAATLRFDASGALTGTGSVTLNGIGFNVAVVELGFQTVPHGANHTIHGKGTIIGYNGGTLINNGTIMGDDPAGSMQVDLSSSSNPNNGALKATSGGLLGIYGGTIDQTGGGTIMADGNGSLVQFAARNGNIFPIIIGGTLNTSNGGLIQADQVTLQGVTNNGAIQILPGDLVIVTGTGLTNNGAILVNTTGLNNAATFRFDASGTLTGTGSVTLNGIGFNVAVVELGFQTVPHGANHTIHGKGTIIGYNGGTLINNGTIMGDDPAGSMQVDLSSLSNPNNGALKATSGGLLGIYGGTIDQTSGGTIMADGNGSLVQFAARNGNIFPIIIGGTLNTSNGGLIQADQVTLQGVTNNGAIQILPGDLVIVTGTGLTNNGAILVNTTGLNNAATLRFDASGALTGTGSVTLNGIGFNVAALTVNNVAVTNGVAHTIGGNGDLFIDGGSALLTNNGIIAPHQLNFRGILTLGLTSNLSFEIGGTTQGTQYDLLNKTDGGTLTLNGNLTVSLINNFTPVSSDVFTIVTTQTILAGAFNNVPSGGRLNTVDGTGSFVVTYHVPNNPALSQNVTLSNFGPPIVQLLNISTRMRVLPGDNVLIGGFIVTGSEAKRAIVRGLGPSLTNQGVPGALQDPTLELHDGTGVIIASNDNWRDTQQAEIEATGIAPTNDLESAIVATLPANNSAYTAILRGKNGTSGVGLVEVYDLARSANSRLANVSTRGFVDTGDNVMIGGIIVGPSTAAATMVLVRAIGPSLSSVPNALQDPTLELHDGNGNLIAFNDNWRDTQQAAIEATGIAPTADAESAILETVAPGNYTAIVRGAGNTTGVGLVEVYDLR